MALVCSKIEQEKFLSENKIKNKKSIRKNPWLKPELRSTTRKTKCSLSSEISQNFLLLLSIFYSKRRIWQHRELCYFTLTSWAALLNSHLKINFSYFWMAFIKAEFKYICWSLMSANENIITFFIQSFSISLAM